jgi:hypothetical protein
MGAIRRWPSDAQLVALGLTALASRLASPEARAAYYDDLRSTVAGPVKHKDYLMRTSMISSLRDVAKIL